MDNHYLMITPPFPLTFREMSKERAREYLRWFQEQIPERISILSRYIRFFPDFKTWEPNLQPSSLDTLGIWFFERVTTRKRSQDETEKIYSNAPDWFRNIEIPDYDLTAQMFSLSIDIGMYVSQIMMKNNPDLRWELGAKPKNSINYQQPVIVGPGKLVFNPVHIVTTLAYGLVDRTYKAERLRELFELWTKIVTGEDE